MVESRNGVRKGFLEGKNGNQKSPLQGELSVLFKKSTLDFGLLKFHLFPVSSANDFGSATYGRFCE